jgi:hypothetical protein
MRIQYVGRIALLLACQMALVVSMFRFGDRWLHTFVALAHLVPFAAGIALFYRAPAFAATRPGYRVIGLAVIFGVASAACFWVSLFIVFIWLMAFGGHHW